MKKGKSRAGLARLSIKSQKRSGMLGFTSYEETTLSAITVLEDEAKAQADDALGAGFGP